MVRINLVPPEELMDQHLNAEYVEIRMLAGSLKRTLSSKKGFVESKVPKQFTLNAGHIYFFYPRGLYLHERYNLIREEMIKRGFKSNFDFPQHVWPEYLYNAWEPSERDLAIIRQRLSEKIAKKPNWYKYYGKPIGDQREVR